MHQWMRPLLVVLMLAFLAGTMMHASRSAAMDIAMAGAAAGMHMPGCDGCDDDGDTPQGPGAALCAAPCALSCAPPPVMAPAAEARLVVTPARPGPIPATAAPPGFDRRPDPHPPKAFVLS